MSAPRRPGPGDAPGRPGSDPALDALMDYLATTAVSPPGDLTARIHARIALEPDRTPPRRFLLAVLHLRMRSAIGAFRQLVRVAGGQGRYSALLRAQALGLVLVTVLSAVALGAGVTAGVARVLQDRHLPTPTVPAPTERPTTTPEQTPSVAPSATPSASAEIPAADPTAGTPDATPRPARAQRPARTSSPTGTRHATPEPGATHKPKTTERPEPTRTPRPARTPEPTERPEPTDPPDSGGEGSGKQGPDETDAPSNGSVWSGGVLIGGLVPPSWSDRSDGPV